MRNIFYKQISFTVIDFPGELAAMYFVRDCSMSCPYCYNMKKFNEYNNVLDNDYILNYLRERKDFLSGVVLSGGEVLLDKYINTVHRLLLKIKDIGYKVKIDTNGLHPKNLRRLVDNDLVDYVAMDVKSKSCFIHPTALYEDKNVFNIKYNSPQIETFKLLVNNEVPFELRTTMVDPFINGNDLIDIAKLLIKETKINKIRSWFLQEPNLDKDIVLSPECSMSAIPLSEIVDIQKRLKNYVDEVSIR